MSDKSLRFVVKEIPLTLFALWLVAFAALAFRILA